MLPRVAALIERARAAGVAIAYTIGQTGGTVLAEMAPAAGDLIVQGGQNKFRHTMLDDFLRANGVKSIVLTGWRANGSVLFTAHGATVLRYTVVIPTDATSAAQDHDYAIGLYMVLNLFNSNLTNEPLKQGAVTLSRTDLITFE